jgi:hypothetical protein
VGWVGVGSSAVVVFHPITTKGKKKGEKKKISLQKFVVLLLMETEA